MKVYAIFDSKACAYLVPFFCPNRAVAMRSFTRAVMDEESDFHRFAGDYTLFELGEWDQDHGQISMYESGIERVAMASEVLAQMVAREGEQRRLFEVK